MIVNLHWKIIGIQLITYWFTIFYYVWVPINLPNLFVTHNSCGHIPFRHLGHDPWPLCIIWLQWNSFWVHQRPCKQEYYLNIIIKQYFTVFQFISCLMQYFSHLAVNSEMEYIFLFWEMWLSCVSWSSEIIFQEIFYFWS